MVVWLFAGGGHSELTLPYFFRKHFPCQFELKLPVRIRAPLPVKAGERRSLPKSGMGHSGKGLRDAVQRRLQESLDKQRPPNLILVMDDLDCHDRAWAEQGLQKAVQSVPNAAGIPLIIAFAVPEIESWLLADWDHTFGTHTTFRSCSAAMRHYLSRVSKVNFAHPETFSEYDPAKKSCKEKLSEAIADAYLNCPGEEYFSKREDTGALLPLLDPAIVASKCPHFRQFWSELRQQCATDVAPHGT
ncbi:MAG: DUF4276 family protein [Magnetococcales bacterium]|nr:DUF4276 family protein [Magnetococcales bacterium]